MTGRSILSTAVRYALLGAGAGVLAGLSIDLLGYAYDNIHPTGEPGGVGTLLGILLGVVWIIGSFPLVLSVGVPDQTAAWLPPLNLALWGFAVGAGVGMFRAAKAISSGH
jgi:hypothetical protein